MIINYKKGFTLLETIIYIALLSFVISTSTLFLYSFLETSSKIQSEINIEKDGLFILQKIEQMIVADIPIQPHDFNTLTSISDFDISYTVITEHITKVVVSFSIRHHFFTFTHIIEKGYAS